MHSPGHITMEQIEVILAEFLAQSNGAANALPQAGWPQWPSVGLQHVGTSARTQYTPNHVRPSGMLCVVHISCESLL